MKTLVSALILSATFMGSAYAGELDYPPAPDTQSSLTRVQVQQELAAAAPTASWCPVKKVIPPPPTPKPATRPAPRCSKSWLPPVRKA